MREWGANVVRIPVYQRYWLRDLTDQGITYASQTYRELIASTVERANAAGLDVVIDLHASDRGDPTFPDDVATIQQMADVNHSIPFWREVATRFRNNGRVIFQLYNEPNQIGWELWRNGGVVPAGETFPPQSSGVEFVAAGMQQLYDAVRSTGAHNVVLVNGLHWGYDLSRLPEFAIDGYNIVYATHPYDYPDKQPDRWEREWGFVAETYPLMVAEFGDYECNAEGYHTAVLDYADARGLSWIAWAWWAPPPEKLELICGFPALITDWPVAARVDDEVLASDPGAENVAVPDVLVGRDEVGHVQGESIRVSDPRCVEPVRYEGGGVPASVAGVDVDRDPSRGLQGPRGAANHL